MNTRLKLLSLITLTTLTVSAQAADYEQGTACVSSGEWTRTALEQTAKLRSEIIRLRDDEECKGVRSLLSSVDTYTLKAMNDLKSLGDSSVETSDLTGTAVQSGGMDAARAMLCDSDPASCASGGQTRSTRASSPNAGDVSQLL
ncbi:MAG: hypothetical protein EOP09_17600, partial [Proteobacteria bacterium]